MKIKTHEDYVTHINNQEDVVYLRTNHFPVNMRLFKTSPEYKAIILLQCAYIRQRCLDQLEGYKKPHGMSSANLGLAHNIIGITRNRNTDREYSMIMINPVIKRFSKDSVESYSNCGSLTLDAPILIERHSFVVVNWFDESGNNHEELFERENCGFTIQHEIDHNIGVLITDRVKE